jgi:hypothetical protein
MQSAVSLLPGRDRGAEIAPQATRPRPCMVRTARGSRLPAKGAAVGAAPWLGPQTALEGRPLAIMVAGAQGRYAA